MGDDNEKFQAKLPAKISGIVFWGLVFVGLLVAVFMLEKAESELYSIHKSNVRLIAYELEEVLEADATGEGLSLKNARLKNTINQLRSEMGFTSVHLDSDEDTLKLGGANPNDDMYPFTFYYYSQLVSTIKPVYLRVYYPNQQAEIADIRKNMLMMIGSTVIVFGLLLQQILQKLLSAPFMNMVNVARQFSEGKETVRFDQSRQDEFGYLGRFINNAIDSLLKNQQGLVTALERAFDSEMELNAEKERVEVTLQSITESVITINTLERIEYINPAAEALLGIDLEAAMGRKFTDIVTIVSDTRDGEITSPIHDCFNNGDIIKLPEHSSLINGESSLVAIEATIAPMKSEADEIIGAVMVIQDVSHTRRLTRQLSYQASHDMLTGLFNRRKFEEHLEEVLLNVVTENRMHSLCYLDLDQFKVVNDTCGHVAGDELLQQLPALFNSVLRTGDVIARLGGDEFGILLENCGVAKASVIAETLRQTIKDFRFIWRDKSFEIGVSIGVVAITPDNFDMATIMSSADLACYAAKDGGRNRVHIYELSDEAVSMRYGEMHWTARITRAMEED
ncbi:MAG: diguanylate cyclase, partial [Gammaproteobacteria bacterium]